MAQKKDFKLALQQCNDLGTKVDAFNTALKELENKKKTYDDALAVLLPKFGKVTQSKFKKLEQTWQEMAQARKEMELSAQKEAFEQRLEQCNDLGTKVDACKAALRSCKIRRRLTKMRW